MNDIKIIFFDIDGTLIDMHTKNISEKMLETLIRLKENGNILCIATGRSPADDICGHVSKDGIYHYCLAHGLI